VLNSAEFRRNLQLSYIITMTTKTKVSKKDERKACILGHIVHTYVSDGTPVSSKLVARRMGGNVSSATIRNIMAELEHQGYITHPHTSAGRIPTDIGYRHYVDVIKNRIRFERREAQRLAEEYSKRIRTIKEVIKKTSYLISRELHNAGVVMWPGIEGVYLKHMDLVKVNSETILAVLVTMTNDVKNHIVRLDGELKKTELMRITNYINENFRTLPLMDISGSLRGLVNNVKEEDKETLSIAKNSLRVMDTIIEENLKNEIYWEGLNYFLEMSGSGDVDMTRNILEIFSEKEELVNLMRNELPYEGLNVYIGNENKSKKLSECSVITCGYTLHGRAAGRLGVIGPTRMDYDHALRTVGCLSNLISKKLAEINS